MNNTNHETLELAKNELKLKFKPMIMEKLSYFDENYKTMIALGSGYQPTIIKQNQISRIEKRQIQNEQGEMEEIDVEVFDIEEIEEQNPTTKEEHIACHFFDILFNFSVETIKFYQENIMLPSMLAEAINGIEL